MTITLHCFGESGHSYKVALALELMGLDWTAAPIDFFSGETRSDDWRAAHNEMGEAPVFEDGDLRLTQSGVILDHLVGRTGTLGWSDEAERREVFRWLFWDNHKMSSQAGVVRFLTNFLSPEKRSPDVVAFMEGRLLAALAVLDAHLEGRDWVATDAPSIADLSCASYLFYPEPFGFDRSRWPQIDRWLYAIQDLPGWRAPYDLMPRAWRAAA